MDLYQLVREINGASDCLGDDELRSWWREFATTIGARVDAEVVRGG